MTIRMSDNLVAFAGENLDVYKGFQDYWNHYQSTQVKDKTYSFDATKSLDEKERIMNAALKKEILRVAGLSNISEFPLATYATNPNLVWAAFAVVNQMVDLVLPQTIIDSIGLYAEVRNIGWGDTAAFDIKSRDLFNVSRSGRKQGVTEMYKQYEGTVVVNPEMHELTVGVSLYRVLAGNESLAEFTAKMIRSMETQLTVEAFTLFNTTMAALDNTAGSGLRVAGYTQTALVNLAQKVQAYSNGIKPVIVGTPVALISVLPTNTNFRYMLESDYVKIGYVQTFNGYDVMAIPQVAAWKTPFTLALDDAKLYVVAPASNKIVKVVLEGNTLANTTGQFQNKDLSQTSTVWKSWGMAVATNAVAACLTLP